MVSWRYFLEKMCSNVESVKLCLKKGLERKDTQTVSFTKTRNHMMLLNATINFFVWFASKFMTY